MTTNSTHRPRDSRPRIAILFGGRSPEHDVSILSAANVVAALDADRYDVLPIFVTREGHWLLLPKGTAPSAAARVEEAVEVSLVPGGHGRMLAIPQGAQPYEVSAIDVLFPVLHGMHGEDGSVQGLASVARVPLAGCGLLGSVTAIDKDIAKRLLRDAGLPVAKALCIQQDSVPSFDAAARELGLPLFIKPARQGSSVGVSKVKTQEDFAAALAEGFRHDGKLLAEEFIAGREIEFSVLEHANGDITVSLPGEIAPAESHGFYSYEAKYVDEAGAALRVPAQLPKAIEDRLRRTARQAFKALGCDGMARVDFFLMPDMTFVVNELNTIPGFTNISMYAKAMAASGVGYAEVLDVLIDRALARGGG
ncbi:D-alanine--D-alanine ligase family protein [Rhizobium sp. AN80A]|uniref:D-alanine--D-alanine ligase family protein n=1 Tax=Rhizobium sp. AN80A TaxID=3040673 RepID=UPI0024B38C4C|nr:D-alanine--D-alanine ligase family protein [Rhizobium sp. AN80A]